MSKQVVAQVGQALNSPEHGTSFAVTLMEHLVVPTFVLDAEQRVMIWNKACERLTGVSAAEVIGTREHWRAFYDAPRPCLADLVATGDWEAIGQLYTTHEDPGTPAFGVHAENWCVMPVRNHRLYLAVDAGPVYDDAGNLTAVVETLRDITEKMLAQTKVQEQASILQVHYEAQQREAELARNILEYQIRTDLMRQAGVSYSVTPASNFSGDVILAARSPDGKLYAVLADATGHGLAAAVSVLPIVQEFYRLVELSRPVRGIAESINFLLANTLPLGRFVAAAVVCIDDRLRCGEIWVGGLPEVLLVGPSGRVSARFPSRNLPLGVSRDPEMVDTVEVFSWRERSRLVMLSDGVLEAADAAEVAFGEACLLDALDKTASAEDILASLQAALATHLNGQAAHDDMSILVINCPAVAPA